MVEYLIVDRFSNVEMAIALLSYSENWYVTCFVCQGKSELRVYLI